MSDSPDSDKKPESVQNEKPRAIAVHVHLGDLIAKLDEGKPKRRYTPEDTQAIANASIDARRRRTLKLVPKKDP